MKHILAVTGVPCSGKTTLCAKLGDALKAKVVNLTSLVEENKLYCGVDAGRDAKIVDVDKLREYVAGIIDSDTILDGLLSHHLEVTHILLLRCDPRVLLERMKARGYSREKILENLEAEYLGVILDESLGCDNLLESDNTEGADLDEIAGWFKSGGRRVFEKDWSKEFTESLEAICGVPRSPI